MAPKTPNALPRSFEPSNVVVSSDSAAGASSAPKAPWQARAAMSMPKLPGGAADRGRGGEADQADDERRLPADQVGEPAAEQQQAAEGEGVGGDHPLPLDVGEVQGLLR